MLMEPNQVAFLGCYVLAGYLCGPLALERRSRSSPLRGSVKSAGVRVRLLRASSRRCPAPVDLSFPGSLQPPRDGLQRGRAWIAASRILADGHRRRICSARSDPAIDYWGPYSEVVGQERAHAVAEHEPDVLRHAADAAGPDRRPVARRALWRAKSACSPSPPRFSCSTRWAATRRCSGYSSTTCPGVAFFRRPVDATFLIGALLAIVAGYLVHLWASGSTALLRPGDRQAAGRPH